MPSGYIEREIDMRLGRASESVQALRSIPLLRDLGRPDLEHVAKMSYHLTRQPGDVLLRQGDVGAELLLLLEGTVRVERDGQEVGEMGRHSVIGEMALIDNYRRSATVIANTPCELLAIPYNEFWSFVERVPSVQRQLLITLSRRVRELEHGLTG